MRFLGNIEAKIDIKGRAFLPATFRKILLAGGNGTDNADNSLRLVLRKDVFQPCLVLYPESVWNEQMDLMRQRLNRWNKQQQQVFRQFVSQVEIVTLDGNGRFLIPRRYLRMAEIEQDIKFTGMGDTIEIWNSQKAEQQQMKPEEFGAALERAAEAGVQILYYSCRVEADSIEITEELRGSSAKITGEAHGELL